MEQVSYFNFEGAPGRYFRCERYGTMSTSACARNFEAAPAEVRERGRLGGCIRCPIGAQHSSGEISMAPQPAGWCVRCRRAPEQYNGAGISRVRLVNGGVCVSCANRQYEVTKGLNAKGVVPKKWASLGPRITGVLEDGRVRVARQSMAKDQLEVSLIALRRNSRALACWVSPGVLPAPVSDVQQFTLDVVQLDLFGLTSKSRRPLRAEAQKCPTIVAHQLALFEDS